MATTAMSNPSDTIKGGIWNDEKAAVVQSFKNRRSSVRHSINNASGTANFLVICSTVSSLPTDEKKTRLTELCINHALQTLRLTVSDEEADAYSIFEKTVRARTEKICSDFCRTNLGTISKQPSQFQKDMDAMKEENAARKAEYDKRIKALKKAKEEMQAAVKGTVKVPHSQKSKLSSKDLKFTAEHESIFSTSKKSLESCSKKLHLIITETERRSLQIAQGLSSNTLLDQFNNKLSLKPTIFLESLSLSCQTL